jgi:hypothetical protein
VAPDPLGDYDESHRVSVCARHERSQTYRYYNIVRLDECSSAIRDKEKNSGARGDICRPAMINPARTLSSKFSKRMQESDIPLILCVIGVEELEDLLRRVSSLVDGEHSEIERSL